MKRTFLVPAVLMICMVCTMLNCSYHCEISGSNGNAPCATSGAAPGNLSQDQCEALETYFKSVRTAVDTCTAEWVRD